MTIDLQTILADGELLIRSGTDPDGITPAAVVAAGGGVLTSTSTASGKGWVNHGSTAGTARPSGYASIEWYGTVAPANAITGDTWISP